MVNKDIEVKPSTAPFVRGAEAWRSFRDELDRVFDRFNQTLPFFGGLVGTAPKLPSVDIAEIENAYVVTAELPGMTAEDVDVTVTEDRITIKGEKQSEHQTEEKNLHLTERSFGAFERSFYLPEDVDRDAISAAVTKGVLTVTLPKTAPTPEQIKKIEIKST